jgi:hypothetical protein
MTIGNQNIQLFLAYLLGHGAHQIVIVQIQIPCGWKESVQSINQSEWKKDNKLSTRAKKDLLKFGILASSLGMVPSSWFA